MVVTPWHFRAHTAHESGASHGQSRSFDPRPALGPTEPTAEAYADVQIGAQI